jgi:hypothetical protein
VTDMESPSSAQNVSVLSSNPTLVPNQAANLSVRGTGNIRTLNINPATGVEGFTTITVTASDGTLSSSKTIAINVTNPLPSPTPTPTPTASPTPSPLSPRQTWWNNNFGVPDPSNETNAITADADGDGLINILEYAFGGDPCRPDAAERSPVLTRDPEGIRLTYGPLTSGVMDAIETSTDVSSGWTIPSNLIRSTNPSGVVTALDLLGIPPIEKKFYRVRIIDP